MPVIYKNDFNLPYHVSILLIQYKIPRVSELQVTLVLLQVQPRGESLPELCTKISLLYLSIPMRCCCRPFDFIFVRQLPDATSSQCFFFMHALLIRLKITA